VTAIAKQRHTPDPQPGDASVTIQVLDREMFSEAEAARLLQLSQSTLHWWLDGGVRRNRKYPPVLRTNPKGARSVTWAEFVEAGLLRQYRRVHHVPLPELRAAIDILRDQLGVPYPLAHASPYVGEGRRLLLAAQEQAGLDAEYSLVAVASGQLLLTPATELFFERVEWADDVAVAWRPHADSRSPVIMRPDIRFGLPSVRGIRTEVVWEHLEEADESVDEVAEQFDLSPDEVRWAYAYEVTARAS
jgi:uncharacterized protein (DUF433 family)